MHSLVVGTNVLQGRLQRLNFKQYHYLLNNHLAIIKYNDGSNNPSTEVAWLVQYITFMTIYARYNVSETLMFN